MPEPTPGDLLTELVDEVFRLAGALGRQGEDLIAPFGLTVARWRTLGALQDGPMTAAGIARRRGLSRQSVRESCLRLERDGLISRAPDPGDARAPLLQLTDEGRAMLRAIEPRRLDWADSTASRVGRHRIDAALTALRRLGLSGAR